MCYKTSGWRFKFEHSGGGEVLFSNCTIEVSAQLTDVDCICRNRCKSFKNFGSIKWHKYRLLLSDSMTWPISWILDIPKHCYPIVTLYNSVKTLWHWCRQAVELIYLYLGLSWIISKVISVQKNYNRKLFSYSDNVKRRPPFGEAISKSL